jgi:outer membrane protein TolC
VIPAALLLSLAATGPGPWWDAVGDDHLAPLVEEALANNGDIDAARWQALALESAATAQLAPMLPTVSIDASGNVAPLDSLGFQFGGLAGGAPPPLTTVPLPGQFAQAQKEKPPDVYYTGQAALSARLNIDVGRSFMSQRAAAADAAASRDDRDAQALGVGLQVARTYFDLVSARQQELLVRQQIETNQGVLDVIELRFRSGGEASGLDVLQQRQNLAATETLLPTVSANTRVLAQQLAQLLGRAEADAPVVADVLPTLPAAPTLADVEQMIEERPDVRAARDRIDAARARETSAMLGFLPTFGLNAQAGQQAFVLDVDDPSAQAFWGAGASVSIPLFVGGQRYALLEQAGRGALAADARLRQLRLRARQAAFAALTREAGLTTQLAAANKQLEAAELALLKSKERYVSGLASYQAVQVALNTTLSSRLTVLSTHRQLVDARLQLLDAVGGSWTDGVGDRRTP